MAGDLLRVCFPQAREPPSFVFLLKFWPFKNCFGYAESLRILFKF